MTVTAAATRIRRGLSAFVADTRLVLNRPVREVIMALASIAFVVWAFKLLNNDFLYSELGFDEQHFVWGGWCVLKKLVPYRDFSEFKPPMIFLTHALALALHGFRDMQFRWFFFYFPMLSLIALYLAMLTRKIDKLCALALILAIMHVFLSPTWHDTALSDTESIGLTYYFFGLAALIARSRLGGKLKAVGVGLLVCCAFSKEPFMPVVFFTWIGCFLLDARKGARGSEALQYLKWTAIGGGIVVLGLCLYLVPTGGMGYYLRMVASYGRIYKDPQHSYCVMFGRFAPTDAVSDIKTQYDALRTDFLNLKVLGYLVPFVVPFILFVPRQSISLALTAVMAFAAGFWAVTASKCGWYHYYVMAMSGVFFVPVLGLDAMARRFPGRGVPRLAGWFLLAVALAAVGPRLDDESNRHERRKFANAYDESVPGSLAYIAKHTTPADRIFTDGAPGLYVQANRLGAVRESAFVDAVMYGYPGKTDIERLSVVKAELEKSMPKVVVLDPAYDGFRPKHLSLLFIPFLKAHGYKQEKEHFWLRPY